MCSVTAVPVRLCFWLVMPVTEWHSDPKWPPLFTATGFCTCGSGQTPDLQQYSDICNVLLIVLWRLRSWIITLLVNGRVTRAEKEKMDGGGGGGEVDWVSSPVCLYRWPNGPLTVIWMILMNWLTGAVMSLFPLGGHVRPPCLPCAQCAQCVQAPIILWAVWRMQRFVRILIGSPYLVLTSPSTYVGTALPALYSGCRDAICAAVFTCACLKKKKRKTIQVYNNRRRNEGSVFLKWEAPRTLSQTDAYLYLFALHYMNYRVALVSWQEVPMGCECRRMSEPLC